MNNNSKKMIIILGAPKSGIMLLTESLAYLGLKKIGLSGPGELDRGLEKTYRQLGRELGFDPAGSTPMPGHWQNAAAAKTAREKLKNMLEYSTNQGDLFVHGHPFTCRFLPLWEAILKELGIEMNMINLIRHPWEVAHSLAKSEGMNLDNGYLLWSASYRNTNQASRNCKHVPVNFERFLKEPLEVLKDIGSKLELAYSYNLNTVYPLQLSKIIQPDKRRFYSSEAPPEQLRLYRVFHRLYEENYQAKDVPKLIEPLNRKMKELLRTDLYHKQICSRMEYYKKISGSMVSENINSGLELIEDTTFWGQPIFLIPGETVSSIIYALGIFEVELTTFFVELLKPGQTVIDVGAHLGYFSMLAAELVGEKGWVVSFEPTPSTMDILTQNINPYPQVAAVSQLAWHRNEKIDFKVFDPAYSAFNTAVSERLHKDKSSVSHQSIIEVEAVTLDHYCSQKNLIPDLVKIDAENSEIQVLKGMIRLLEEVRPVLTIEVGDFTEEGNTEVPPSKDLISHVRSYDYIALEVLGYRLKNHIIHDRKYDYDNIVLVPREKIPARIYTEAFFPPGF